MCTCVISASAAMPANMVTVSPAMTASTLAVMAGLTVTMFAGITALALITHVHIAGSPAQLVGAPEGYAQRTVIAQLAGAVFGSDSAGFFVVQSFTTLVLVLAANTAFNGFPILASILSSDGFLPRQMSRRGDRLVFSNGILILAGFAAVLLVAFQASPPGMPRAGPRRSPQG